MVNISDKSNGILSYVSQQKHFISYNNISDKRKLNIANLNFESKLFNEDEENNIKSILCIPIFNQELLDINGIILGINKNHNGKFTELDISTMQMFAVEIGHIIEKSSTKLLLSNLTKKDDVTKSLLTFYRDSNINRPSKIMEHMPQRKSSLSYTQQSNNGIHEQQSPRISSINDSLNGHSRTLSMMFYNNNNNNGNNNNSPNSKIHSKRSSLDPSYLNQNNIINHTNHTTPRMSSRISLAQIFRGKIQEDENIIGNENDITSDDFKEEQENDNNLISSSSAFRRGSSPEYLIKMNQIKVLEYIKEMELKKDDKDTNDGDSTSYSSITNTHTQSSNNKLLSSSSTNNNDDYLISKQHHKHSKKSKKKTNNSKSNNNKIININNKDYFIRRGSVGATYNISSLLDGSALNTKYRLALKDMINLTFDPFEYNFNDLRQIVISVFDDLNILTSLKIPIKLFINFIYKISILYNNNNPYHNYYHGFAVFSFTYSFIKKTNLSSNINGNGISKLEILSLLISSLCHDVDHPGNTNTFEIETNSKLAIKYNDQSVLENHHCCVTFETLNNSSCNFISHLNINNKKLFRKRVIRSILFTDMSHHFELCSTLDNIDKIIINNLSDTNNDKIIQLICNVFVHTADVTAPVQPLLISLKWAKRVCKEFTNQVKKEKKLNIKSSQMMLNLNKNYEFLKSQRNFIKFVLRPLFKSVARLFTNLNHLYIQLLNNEQYYQNQLDKLDKLKKIQKESEKEKEKKESLSQISIDDDANLMATNVDNIQLQIDNDKT